MADILILYHEGMDYGIGIDSPSGDTRSVGVLGTPTVIPNAGGSIVDFELTEISSDEDLQTALGVSVSASCGIGLFGASASLDFARKCHVHSNSVFLLVSVKVNLAFSQIRAPKIDPEAAAKLSDGNTTRFQEMFGDAFVRGMQTGGRFFAVVEIFTFLDLPRPPNFIDLEHQMDVLAFCAKARNRIWTALNNVNFIFDNPAQFALSPGEYDRTLLTTYRQALETDLDAVAKASRRTRRDLHRKLGGQGKVRPGENVCRLKVFSDAGELLGEGGSRFFAMIPV